MWSIGLTIGLIISTIFVGRKKRIGWFLHALTEVAWFVYAIKTRQWGFLAAAVIFFALYVKYFFNWKEHGTGSVSG